MRKVVYGGACSLDGYVAGPGAALDWLHFSAEVHAIISASWASADAVLFGRKTWEFSVAQGGGGAMPGVASYLFSRTMTTAPAGVELVRDDAGAYVHDLKRRPGKDILVMSGGNLARSLFDADAIDEVGLNIHPLLLGSGVPAFLDTPRRVPLELVESRTLEGGCVLLRYRVRHERR